MLPSTTMLRDPRCDSRTARRLAVLAAAALAVTAAGCGIKGPLKRVDAPPGTSTAPPPTTAPDPTLPVK